MILSSRSGHGWRALAGDCARKGVEGHAGVAQVGERAGVLHAVLVQGAAAVLPCRHHCLQTTHAAQKHQAQEQVATVSNSLYRKSPATYVRTSAAGIHGKLCKIRAERASRSSCVSGV